MKGDTSGRLARNIFCTLPQCVQKDEHVVGGRLYFLEGQGNSEIEFFCQFLEDPLANLKDRALPALIGMVQKLESPQVEVVRSVRLFSRRMVASAWAISSLQVCVTDEAEFTVRLYSCSSDPRTANF